MSGILKRLAERLRAAYRKGAHRGAVDEPAFQELFEAADVGIAELDVPTEKFLRVNRRFCEIFMCERDAFLKLGPAAFLPQNSHDEIRQEADSAISASGRWEREVRHVLLDGREVWARMAVSALRRDSKGAPQRLVIIAHDVSDSHRLAESLRQNQEMLQLGQLAGRVGTFCRDFPSGRITFGPEIREIFDLPALQDSARFEDFLACMPREDSQSFQATIADALRRREPELVVPFRLQRQDNGRIRHVELRARYYYDDLGAPLRSVGAVIDLTERYEAERRLQYAAHHDGLTGLANRALFHERLEQACKLAQRGAGVAAFCLDLHRFNDVNDTFGHHVGDRLLKEVGRRLQGYLRDGDTLARLGGDEFALVQVGLRAPEEAGLLAARIVEGFAEAFLVDERRISLTVRLGVALAPRDAQTAADLLKSADLALYGAKTQPQGGWGYFEPSMNAQAQARYEMEADLRAAVAAEAFELHFQPILDVATRQVTEFEALVRWRHPQKGLVQPESFIAACEQNGLILPLGAWVLRRACEEATRWPAAIHVAVNVSAVQLNDFALEATVVQALAASGLAPRRLELEITETALLDDTEAVLAVLRRLKGLGVRIAMDDFGAGHSSLGYLQTFPFDKVKIDRAFAANVDRSARSAAIVKAMLNLCSALEIPTTVEGVETEAQFAALAGMGAQSVQGYLFSRPRPAEGVAEVLGRFGTFGEVRCAAE